MASAGNGGGLRRARIERSSAACLPNAQAAATATLAFDPDRPRLDRLRKVCIFRALQLGDMLCTVPALRSLRAGLPDATIALVGLPWARSFVRRFHRYVDEFIEFPGHPAMPEQPARPQLWSDFVAMMRERRFDLALQMHGSGEISNDVVAAFGAARCAGFCASAEAAPDPGTFLLWQAREPEVLRYVRLMRHLGFPDCGTELEWPLLDDDAAEDLPAALELESYVCVHPGARLLSRRWPVERFAQVADRLAAGGYTVVVTGSTEEMPLAAALVQHMRESALDLAGKTSLGGLAQLIGRARLLVCNDTGVSHVAAAVGTPSVVVCCGADPVRWAPLDAVRHRVLYQPLDCRPCMHAVCPIGHPCALEITPDQVADEAMGALRNRVRSGAGEEVLQ
jgi:ADP-heptose:LPS heptosyltransferase